MLLFNIIHFTKKLIVTTGLVCIISSEMFSKGLPKEYYEISDVNESKKYFFDYLYKLIEKENKSIIKERNFISSFLNKNILSIDFDSLEFKKFLQIKKKYKISKLFDIKSFMKKIDIIPPSQALAQAATESGWGRSRFIKEANNIFGHWTYNPSIGMLPEDRTIGATHFIRIFKSLQASISAYMLNLNRNLAYKTFRDKRYTQRLKNKHPDGLHLSQTMLNYSGIAEEYLKILKDIIQINDLHKYDKKFYQQIN
jgi:Bax protein